MRRYNTHRLLLFSLGWIFLCLNFTQAEKIRDHEVILDEQGRLFPWTSYDNIICWSMNFIKNCPTKTTKFGDDPWYLITAKFNEDGTFLKKQNNQGSNLYWAVQTLKKYYAYTGDHDAFTPVRWLVERVAYYHTPENWAWPNVPRTQDDTPDGEYTDEWGEVDKMCMVALGYIDYFKLTAEKKYFDYALKIAKTVIPHVVEGDEKHSPLPFRVDLKTGMVLDPYCSNMIFVVNLFDELYKFSEEIDRRELKEKRDMVWNWILKYPINNNYWSGYYEDVVSNFENLNQQNPMETARYILRHPEMDPDHKIHVPTLIMWVENRFGRTKRFGATSIREQDSCFVEMSSHTARYASVVAMWYGVTLDPKDKEEARAAFALSTYSAYNKYSKNGNGINYVGIGYEDPWFSDSYWDYLSHYFDGMVELPDMLPDDENHLFHSTSIVTHIQYSPNRIEYVTFDSEGFDLLKLAFVPQVLANGRELDASEWSFGEYRGVQNILRIRREGIKRIEISKR